jgi:hypothetical protein
MEFIHPPRTALSLVHNATSVSNYRREAHEDLRTTFERFDVGDGVIRRACEEIELAAYELRVATLDPGTEIPGPGEARRHRDAHQLLVASTGALFDLLKPEITAFLVGYAERGKGRPEFSLTAPVPPDAWAEADSHLLLLGFIYHSLYAPGFAAAAVGSAKVTDYLDKIDRALVPAITAIASALSTTAPATVSQHVDVVCDRLRDEYIEHGFLACW